MSKNKERYHLRKDENGNPDMPAQEEIILNLRKDNEGNFIARLYCEYKEQYTNDWQDHKKLWKYKHFQRELVGMAYTDWLNQNISSDELAGVIDLMMKD